MKDVMIYLKGRLGCRSEYVSYAEIARTVGKSRHAVAYAIERLKRTYELGVEHGKLYIVDLYQKEA
jgi:biotin operon repressor